MRSRLVGIAVALAVLVGATPAYAVTVVPPPVDARVDYQLGGAYTPAAGVTVVTRDMTSRPAAGTYGICYVNVFQTQPGTRSWWLANHPSLLLRDSAGRLVDDADWPGETLLDTSTSAKRRELLAVADIWLARCAAKGFRAVEPDNLDSWTRSRGRLTMRHNAGFAAALVAHAHARGLAVAQKNDADMLALRSVTRFDFAVVEECQVYAECGGVHRGVRPPRDRDRVLRRRRPGELRDPPVPHGVRGSASCTGTATSCRAAPRATRSPPADGVRSHGDLPPIPSLPASFRRVFTTEPGADSRGMAARAGCGGARPRRGAARARRRSAARSRPGRP